MTPSPILVKAVRESRQELSREFTALCLQLDVKQKIKHSFRQQPFLWLGGVAGAGFLTALLGRKGDKNTPSFAKTSTQAPLIGTAVKVSWIASVLEIGKLLYPILRPIFLEFANKSVKDLFAKQASSR